MGFPSTDGVPLLRLVALHAGPGWRRTCGPGDCCCEHHTPTGATQANAGGMQGLVWPRGGRGAMTWKQPLGTGLGGADGSATQRKSSQRIPGAA